MIDYHTFQQIRQLHDEEHLSCSQIARRLGLHWQTVKKWVGRPRYEQRAAPPPTRRPSKLDAFKGTIVRWLESHPFTGAQLFSRLRAEGYQGGYSILKDFVREVRPKAAPAFLTPVSYTHLDVYKRQAKRQRTLPAEGSLPFYHSFSNLSDALHE